jgi:hypothetical protein
MPWAAIVPSVIASMLLGSSNTAQSQQIGVGYQTQQQLAQAQAQAVGFDLPEVIEIEHQPIEKESNPTMDSLMVLLHKDRENND